MSRGAPQQLAPQPRLLGRDDPTGFPIDQRKDPVPVDAAGPHHHLGELFAEHRFHRVATHCGHRPQLAYV
jgi:hypothetical protein